MKLKNYSLFIFFDTFSYKYASLKFTNFKFQGFEVLCQVYVRMS